MSIKKAAFVFATLGFIAASAHAQDSGTLKKIKDTGVISLGHRESSIPFSFYDDKQNVIGYSQDYALKIVDAVKQKLNMPNLKVKLVPGMGHEVPSDRMVSTYRRPLAWLMK